METKKPYEYKVIYDEGKPYEMKYQTTEEMIKGITEFYEAHKNDDTPFDVMVLNAKDEDITETQFIEEIVADIIGE